MSGITFRLFEDRDAAAFRALNEVWIAKHFAMEPGDYATLDHPRSAVIDKGGAIVVGEKDGVCVATAALVPMGDDVYELAKMTVREDLRGTGAGGALMAVAIAHARKLGARKVYLESNTRLESAIALYTKTGFRRLEDGEGHDSSYARCNIRMELAL